MRLADFEHDAATGIRIAPAGTRPAGYVDGIEGELLAGIEGVADRSVGSEDLRRLVVDWPTLYHLTPYRSTLFDAFGWTGAPARVLELGAGCGAITRWLGEHCGEVHAVEGDPNRARVARARTADLDNVTVYSGNFSGLQEDRAFDVATFIGVLEYGHLYHPDHQHQVDPSALANLTMARRALVDDGVLVLAIENKLGIKYFSGAPEDHSARPYDGIQGYPRSNGAQTWSARELRALLEQAGFASSDWFLPFPDYKLADTIINGERAGTEHHVHNLIGTPAPGRGVERGPIAFNETLAFREATAGGLLVDLSNSFLVLAYAGDPEATRARLGLETDWVARHWSLDRRPEFRKQVTIHAPEDALVVDHTPLHDLPAPGGPLRQELGREPFAAGDLALIRVMETFAVGAPENLLLDHVRELRDHLLGTYGLGLVDPDGLPLLDGGALDASWWNVVRDPATGALVSIDREWHVEAPLPADFVLWRALFYLSGRYQGHIPPHLLPNDRFAAEWTTKIFPETSATRLNWFPSLELAVANAVGVVPDAPAPAELAALAQTEGKVAVLADAAEIVATPALLRAYAAQIGSADPVTLLLYAEVGRAATIVPALEQALADAGLAEDGPDMLVLFQPPLHSADVPALVRRARAVLSDAGAFTTDAAQALRITSADASALRTLTS